MRITKLLLAFSLFTAMLAIGCSGPKLVPVTGKLTMNGAPIKNVKVEFHPDPDKGTKGPSSYGITDAEGNFTLVSNDKDGAPGAIVGHHRVVCTDLDVYGNVFVGRGDYRTEDPAGPKETPKYPRFGAVYSDLSNTPFRQEVIAGMAPVSFDIKK